MWLRCLFGHRLNATSVFRNRLGGIWPTRRDRSASCGPSDIVGLVAENRLAPHINKQLGVGLYVAGVGRSDDRLDGSAKVVGLNTNFYSKTGSATPTTSIRAAFLSLMSKRYD